MTSAAVPNVVIVLKKRQLAAVRGGQAQLHHDRAGVGRVSDDRARVVAQLVEQDLELRVAGQLQLAGEAVAAGGRATRRG